MTTREFQPPLTWRSHLWRYALCLVISSIGWGSVFAEQWESHRGLWWTDLVLGLVAYVVVAFRRRFPLAIAVALSAASALSGLAAGPAVLATVSLATQRDYRRIAVMAVVSFASGEAFTEIQPQSHDDEWWLNLLINLVATVAILGWGLYIGSRRQLIWTLRDQVARAREQLALRTDSARSAERQRIAREMHDVLAHRISQVSMQANAVMYREDLTPAQLRESVAVIQEKANEALVDLRAVLGVLRDGDGAPLDRPQPTYADLAALVAEAREIGSTVLLTEDVEGEVPELAGRTAYRLVQEALTNARKHAPAATVRVSVSGDARRGLHVEVTNPLGFGAQAPESGLGLVGLRERMELAGGRLEVDRSRGQWMVRGWIPWEM